MHLYPQRAFVMHVFSDEMYLLTNESVCLVMIPQSRVQVSQCLSCTVWLVFRKHQVRTLVSVSALYFMPATNFLVYSKERKRKEAELSLFCFEKSHSLAAPNPLSFFLSGSGRIVLLQVASPSFELHRPCPCETATLLFFAWELHWILNLLHRVFPLLCFPRSTDRPD